MLNEILLSVLVTQVPPGTSHYSVHSADCASTEPICPGAKWSTFYQTWVRKETKEEAIERYRDLSNKTIAVAESITCKDIDEKPITDCTPVRGAEAWRTLSLVAITASVVIAESGIREDVLMGRGRSGKPSDDGGEGRGPGNEACYMQIHPSTHADPTSLLGPAGLEQCLREGMRRLVHSHWYCQWHPGSKASLEPWDFKVFSLYGTGNSCISSNSVKLKRADGTDYWFSKTQYRVNLYRAIRPTLSGQLRAARKKLSS